MTRTVAVRWLVAVSVVAASLPGCTAGPTDVRQVESPVAPSRGWTGYNTREASRVNELARVLAAAFSDPAARSTLLRALQVSPMFEHKVTIPEFFGEPAGQAILEAAVQQTGRSKADLLRLISKVPPMDMYVPYWRDRTEWQPEEPINVAALLDNSSPVYAYAGTRDSVFYDRSSSVPVSRQATLLLGPREARIHRPFSAVPLFALATIEDPTEIVQAHQECYEDCGGGGGGGGNPPPPSDSLWGDTLVTHHICDNGNCSEGNEFEISVIYPTGSGYTVRCEGIGYFAVVRMRDVCNGYLNKLSETAPNESPYNDLVRVIETDGFSADDWFYAYIDPPPGGGASGESARVVDNINRNYAWVLNKVNYGAGCAPWCEEWVELQVRW